MRGTSRPFFLVIEAIVTLAFVHPTHAATWEFQTSKAALAGSESAPRISWQCAIGTAGRDDAYDIAPLGKDYVITGSSKDTRTGDTDLVVLRTDNSGKVRWAKRYGGPKLEIGFAVRVVGEDLIAVAGWTQSQGAGAGDFYFLGLDARGNVRFEKTFGDAGEERATALQPTRDGGFLLLGESYSHGNGDSRFYVVKTGRDGELEWEKTYDDGPLNERGLVIIDAEAGYLLVGNAMDAMSGSEATVSDGFVVRIDSSGNERWRRRFGGEARDYLHSGVRLPNGQFLLTGYRSGEGASGGNDVWLTTLAANGEILRQDMAAGGGDDHNIIARVDRGGRVLLGGYSQDPATQDWDAQVLLLDNEGKFVSSWTYAANGEDGAVSLWPDGHGKVVVVGHTTDGGAGGRDILILQIALPPG